MFKNQKSCNPFWQHYEKKEEGVAICNYCQSCISYKSTTGNLRSHMKKKHAHILVGDELKKVDINIEESSKKRGRETELSDPQPQPSTSSVTDDPSHFLNAPKPKRQRTLQTFIPKKISQDEKKKIDRDLLDLFIKDMQPFSIVEDPGFRNLLRWIPGYNPPSRKTISLSLIPALYQKTLNECKAMIESECESLCITTDCWTSCANENYIAVTGHYISKDFVFKSILLECKGFPGNHTAINLAEELKTVAREWKVSNKINFAVSDNAANICNAIQVQLGWKHYGCFAHSLNLLVRDALVLIEGSIENVKKVVSHFKRSSQALEKLLNYQIKHMDINDPKRLLQDVPTRWNSTYYMLKRFVELYEAVKSTMAVINSKDWPIISEEEWSMFRLLVKILAPFEEATSSLSAEKYVTGGLAIVLKNMLVDVVEDFLKVQEYTDTNVVKNVLLKLKSGLETRFQNIEKSRTLGLCTFLDPRFKMVSFKSESDKTIIKKYCQDLMIKVIKKMDSTNDNYDQSITTNNENEKSIWSKVDMLVKESKTPGTPISKAIRELQLYLEDEMLPRKSTSGQWNDPADWWSQHSKMYPVLAEVYRTNCNIVITSVPCERLFSKTGYIINERRNRLSSTKLEQLIFLNANL